MNARALVIAALALGCQRTAPEPPHAAPLTVAPHGAHHADPSPPFALSVTSRAVSDDVAEVKLRVTATTALPSLTVGFTLTQSLARVDGDIERTFAPVTAGQLVELTARVRRTGANPDELTLRAWAEARDGSTVLGDEAPVALFGATVTAQPSSAERIVRAPDGTLLHDTVIR